MVPSSERVKVGVNVAEGINKKCEESFEDIKNQIGAFMYSAILDERTCSICKGLDGTYYEPNDLRLEEIKPPLHVGCRCVFVAVLKEETDRYPVKFTYLTAAEVEKYIKDKRKTKEDR